MKRTKTPKKSPTSKKLSPAAIAVLGAYVVMALRPEKNKRLNSHIRSLTRLSLSDIKAAKYELRKQKLIERGTINPNFIQCNNIVSTRPRTRIIFPFGEAKYTREAQCILDSSQEELSIQSSKKETEWKFTSISTFPPHFIASKEFAQEWSNWEYHRRDRKLSMTKRVHDQHRRLLIQYDVDTAIEMIRQSIKANWQGLFEIKSRQKVTNPYPYLTKKITAVIDIQPNTYDIKRLVQGITSIENYYTKIIKRDNFMYWYPTLGDFFNGYIKWIGAQDWLDPVIGIFKAESKAFIRWIKNEQIELGYDFNSGRYTT